ncbi:hypothetical protein AZI87_07420 [Bdellovibrio bacteriovorus]|uniref:Uncharacterized protein n=1 Tax=Bdellovibrio bacteriovorus TaxID=959 RepID=A0A162GVI6_BDEBC|nr:hypothetical protein [Bdellovibrio bacteriovorus]KYG69045.1 hypothetical protein AZI87_07420 [Bdellovibrio bacteriovorus]
MKPTFLVLLLVFSYTASAFAWVSPYFSQENKRTAFTYVDGDYEDTRIDIDQDKNLDFWRIKKGNLLVEVTNSGSEKQYRIRLFSKAGVTEKIISQKGEDLFEIESSQRPMRYFNFTTEGPVCTTDNSPWKKFLSDISGITRAKIQSKIESSLSEECFNVGEPTALIESIESVLKPPSISNKGNEYLSCLEGEEAKAIFVAVLGKKEGLTNHQKAIVGFKNAIISIAEGKSKEPSFVCKAVDKESKAPVMQTSEKGQIQINLPEGKKLSQTDFRDKIFHEVLHKSAIENEKLPIELTKICSPDSHRVALSKSNSQFRSILANKNFVNIGSKNATEKAPQKIDKNIAEAPAELPKAGSPTDMNRMADAVGAKPVKEASQQQTSPVIRMAEKVLAGSPAVAAEVPVNGLASSGGGGGSSSSTSDNISNESYRASNSSVSSYASSYEGSDSSSEKSSRSTSSRSPASEYKLNTKVVTGSEVAAARNLKKMGSDGLGAGEYIKEEIDLTRGTSYVASAPNQETRPSASMNQRSIASTSGSKISPVVSASEVGNSGSSSGASASLPSSGSGSSGNTGGSLGSSTIPARQANKSNTQRGTASVYIPSQDEVVSFFTSGSYNQARSKLKDQNFINTLKQNSITVIDLAGNGYGASKGQIIFVDQGDRFVRQK